MATKYCSYNATKRLYFKNSLQYLVRLYIYYLDHCLRHFLCINLFSPL